MTALEKLNWKNAKTNASRVRNFRFLDTSLSIKFSHPSGEHACRGYRTAHESIYSSTTLRAVVRNSRILTNINHFS